MGERRFEPLTLRESIESPAAAEQAMLERFFHGVKTYVDERLAEVQDENRERRQQADNIAERFVAHAVNAEGMDKINESRSAVMDLANLWLGLLPAGRDASLAYTALEVASFHATAALSRQKGNQS